MRGQTYLEGQKHVDKIFPGIRCEAFVEVIGPKCDYSPCFLFVLVCLVFSLLFVNLVELIGSR